MSFKSVVDYINALLMYRRRQNSSYSLRSFAGQLGVSPTTLSHLLNRKIKLTLPISRLLLDGLKLKDKKNSRYLKVLFNYEVAVDEDDKARLRTQLAAINPLWSEAKAIDEKKTTILDQWYYLAILELVSIPQFKFTEEKLAQRLGIEASQATAAVNLLVAQGLIKQSKTGFYERTAKQFLIESQAPNLKLQDYHRQTLMLARRALSEQNNSEKVVGSETFSISKEDLAEAQEIVESCFQQILALAQRSQQRTEVYHIGIQLFKLTTGPE